MVVGHVLMVHTCSFMCTNHVGMIVHILAFVQCRKPSCHPDFHHASSRWQKMSRTWWNTNPEPSVWQASTLTIQPVRSMKLSNHAQATKMSDHFASQFIFQFGRNIRQIRQICQLNRNFKKSDWAYFHVNNYRL